MSEMVGFDDLEEIALRLLLDEIKAVVGLPVAMLVFRDPDGTASFMPHPLCGPEIMRYMGSVDWADAERIAKLAQLG